ncbi:unnamed protein product [Phytophthora fragariaefolia]|uniref:Unnamed protein product n=1 Tax=Phytophthora fragariaefolia TaxID=1490495 RepID=A0A9W6XPZ0_9STRA|nr:unnamed protein product [Phytophthora fragariaefolia]
MRPQAIASLLDGYEHRDVVLAIMERGIEPKWLRPPPPSRPVKNHKSCQKHLSAVIRSIRDGQNNGRYMIVDDALLEQWSNVVRSPLGAVEKKDIDPAIEVRFLHDLSFPDNFSTNVSFDKTSALEIRYRYIVAIADRIEDLITRYPQCVIRILKGDVKGAYRHLMVASRHVHWMAARIPEAKALLIDLSAPFGWSGSPPFYSAFGRAIT